jgi:sterol desaturase/sphingolipid hydroxylase (fatty acid hydroxylase superfamily)
VVSPVAKADAEAEAGAVRGNGCAGCGSQAAGVGVGRGVGVGIGGRGRRCTDDKFIASSRQHNTRRDLFVEKKPAYSIKSTTNSIFSGNIMFGLLMFVDVLQYIGSTQSELFWRLWQLTLLLHFFASIVLDGVTFFWSDVNQKPVVINIARQATIESLVNIVVIAPFFLRFFSEHMEHQGVSNSPVLSTLLVLSEFSKVVFYIVIFDVWFEMSHRLLHCIPWLYTHIHARHHSYIYTIAVDALAMHPVEFVGVVLAGCMFGPVIIPPSSIVTLYLYYASAVIANCVVHSQLTRINTSADHVWHHKYAKGHMSAIGIIPRIHAFVTRKT